MAISSFCLQLSDDTAWVSIIIKVTKRAVTAGYFWKVPRQSSSAKRKVARGATTRPKWRVLSTRQQLSLPYLDIRGLVPSTVVIISLRM